MERLCLDCRAVKPKKPLNMGNEFSNVYRAYFLRHFYSSMTRIAHCDGQAQFVNTNVTADGSISLMSGGFANRQFDIGCVNREIKSKIL